MHENTINIQKWHQKYIVGILALFLSCLFGIIISLTDLKIEDALGDGVDLIIATIGLFIIFDLKNRLLTTGWVIYTTGLVIDLLDEFLELPVWLDDYGENMAYGLGLLVIVMAFHMTVREKQQAADHFKGISNLDDLTGLYNHRYFYHYFNETAKEPGDMVLLFCDLDCFKIVNDSYGHTTGDIVLRETAQVIKKTVGDRGTSFRYGGEEIAILLPRISIEEACEIAESVKYNIETSLLLQQYATYFPITVSIGLALYPKHAGNAHDLVAKADAAMYYCKQNGRNQCSVYSPEIDRIFEQGLSGGAEQKMLINSVFSLVSAIDAKDRYTGRHSELVTKYSLQIADALQMSDEDKFRLRIGALLHDCGKIGVPDEIINKRGRLSNEEFICIRDHTVLGYNIIKYITEDSEILSCILHHHEHWDGLGYPHGLAGEKIPLLARIIAIADAFHAMTSDRPYRKALTPDQALDELLKQTGFQFDPGLVKYFVNIYRKSGLDLDLPPVPVSDRPVESLALH